MARLRTLALLPIVALAGCQGSDSPSDPNRGPIPFVSVYRAQYSGIDSYRVQPIESTQEWAAVWQEIHGRSAGPPPLPSVDFSGQRLLLAAAGSRPNGCYSIAVESIARRGSTLEATLVETVPAASCACTQAITQPVHVVALQRSEELITSQAVRRPASCG